MEKLIWAGSSQVISKISGSSTFDYIPTGVWELKVSMTGPFLEKMSDDFNFPYKIYGMEESFIDYTLDSYKHADKNLGVLLNGLKGCGKTVTAKVIANKSKLPVILVTSGNIDVLSYFSNVHQPLCFMFDEFEKIIDHGDLARIAPLLSFVDGTVTAEKHLMIFTSNDQNISDFFIDRPGRIRYVKNYGSLPLKVVEEIIDEKLVEKQFRKNIIDWVMYFKFLTIDILMSIINEVNIHKVSPEVFKDIFNADTDKPAFDVKYKITDPKTGKVATFDTHDSFKGSPVEFLEEILDGDRSFKVLSKVGMSDKDGKIIKMKEGDYLRPVYFSNVHPVNDSELIDGKLLFNAYFGNISEIEYWSDFRNNKGKNCYQAAVHDKEEFVMIANITYMVEVIAERRKLYSSAF